MTPFFKAFCVHSFKAFGFQFVANLIIMLLSFIPVIGRYFGVLTYAYLPTIGLIWALKLFPDDDGPLKWFVGLLLGMVLYSLAWGVFRTWTSR